MIDIAEVARLLFERCEGLSLPLALPEAPNTFSPPADGRYFEARFFPNGNAWEAVRRGALAQGLLQVTAVQRKNRGLVPLYQRAAEAKALFARPLALHGPGVKVTVSNDPVEGAPLVDASEVRVSVTVRWNATAV